MFSDKIKMRLSFLLALVMGISLLCTTAFATTVNVLDGQVSVTDSANSNTVSGGTVTIKASGSLFSKETNNITITNETANTATLSFDYSASTYNSFKIAGASVAASGSYSALLEPGASLTLVLVSNSGLSNRTATLTLSNFSLTVAALSSNVTINYDNTLGSVTAGGVVVVSGTVQEVSLTDGIELVASANSGATFLGWVDTEDGEILSTAASFTLTPADDMTVKAIFTGADSAPHFGIGAMTQKSASTGFLNLSKIYYYRVESFTHIFDDLNTAAAAAAASTGTKAVVLLNSATLSAGDYTIPSGVTLLIPFDTANTMYTTEAEAATSYTKPATPYRTLTLASGANLILNGSMSVSAKHCQTTASSLHGGSPTGSVAYVKMAQGSNITIKNGGALYAYGYITGTTAGNFTQSICGTITAESGSSVYENFQIADFRGGSQSTNMKNKVFPLAQYYIQNIEVPMTLNHGAKEYAYTTVAMSSYQFASAVEFVGSTADTKSKAMFKSSSGYIVKRYDGSADRLIVDIQGDISVSSVELDINGTKINSASYNLPINGNMTVNFNSGNATINQDMALLPGTVFTVGENATCSMGKDYKIYVYDAEQWGTYCGSANKTFMALEYVPGRTYTRTDADLVDAKIVVNGTVDASLGNAYTTASGANICSDGGGIVKVKDVDDAVTHQVVQAAEPANSAYPEIPVKAAWLKNADGCNFPYTMPKEAAANTTYTYTYTDGRWTCAAHTPGDGVHVCAADWTCVACGTTVKASAHTEETVPGTPATCTESGLTDGVVCSVCGVTTVAQETIDALGHTEEIVPGYAATCTEPGLTEGKHCETCGETITPQEVVPAYHTCTSDSAPYMICPGCAGAFIRCENGNDFVYEEFTLTLKDWYAEAYVGDSTAKIGFSAEFRGNEAAYGALTDVGFLINDQQYWAKDYTEDTWTDHPENKDGVYYFRCGVATTQNTNTVTGLLDFNGIIYSSQSAQVLISEMIDIFDAADGTQTEVQEQIVAEWAAKDQKEEL